MSDDRLTLAEQASAEARVSVPKALYWEARARRAELEAAQLRLEMTLREIERTNGLLDFSAHRYRWDDEGETVTVVD